MTDPHAFCEDVCIAGRKDRATLNDEPESVSEPQTPHKRRTPCCSIEAHRFLDNNPAEGHYFTVDSLAAALDPGGRGWYEDDGRYSDKDYAAAIIQAAKEAERE